MSGLAPGETIFLRVYTSGHLLYFIYFFERGGQELGYIV